MKELKKFLFGRRALINRHVFSCYNSNAWPSFMDYIAKVYDFSKIKNIILLADGGKWIKSGISELKLYSTNKVTYRLCQFHFKQAINRITTDTDERTKIFNEFKTKPKQDFEDYVNSLITVHPERKDKITTNLDYIINNYKAINDMLDSKIGSSMESHISHLIASMFSARPKGFGSKNIDKYLQLNDYKNNGLNIFNLYLQSCNLTDDEIVFSEQELLEFSVSNTNSSNIPIFNTGKSTEAIYSALKVQCHQSNI